MNALTDYQIRETATIEQAIALIQKNSSRCVIVVNSERKVVGAFSEGDVLRAILAGTDIHTPLRGLLKPSFRYLRTLDMAAARRLLISSGITLLPVIDDDFRLQSVIRLQDAFSEEAV